MTRSKDECAVVSGHQPNFFPWFGYFEKMAKSDVFVFSDDVKYPKQCYVNRVTIPVGGGSAYLTLPVSKGNDQRIADKKYVKSEKELNKILKTINLNLSGMPYSHELAPICEELASIYFLYSSVAEINIHMNMYIASLLGIDVEFKKGTELGLEAFHKNERLIRRCEVLGSSVYLSGQGADGYQDESLLNQAGIELRKVEYDIGKALLGPDLQHSILVAIARKGAACLKQAIRAQTVGLRNESSIY
ncbi:hypothetical protein EUZ85_13385 [Hahella sp. KA22]|uniref:WbqC family protein n=1 Tax=Hahella sp. KA22 TaxID=1628392 RepID=UPI000FDDF582|nr:WbqC family protein [Hahella sp. KA22]AZZ91668.1 hypothetical protein ENC22_10825 [Hahella sp. KA22]QAY55038.1 hypothetical protein EUZ85_13385 [Hahella sp. KA22]